jgi:hypothetical protein
LFPCTSKSIAPVKPVNVDADFVHRSAEDLDAGTFKGLFEASFVVPLPRISNRALVYMLRFWTAAVAF